MPTAAPGNRNVIAYAPFLAAQQTRVRSPSGLHTHGVMFYLLGCYAVFIYICAVRCAVWYEISSIKPMFEFSIPDLIDALQFALILVTWGYLGKVARQVRYLSEREDK